MCIVAIVALGAFAVALGATVALGAFAVVLVAQLLYVR